jgi:60 kDa SS-A/Ro ribonucleoprotein
MDSVDSMPMMFAAPVPQCQPLGDTQAQNAAGGFAFVIDDMVRLRRFLILGSEGGTCYASERELGMENVLALFRLLAQPEKGLAAVELIRDVSVRGLAHKQGPTMLALAVCARRGDEATRAAAYGVLGAVCRIPTHLFQFVGYAEAVGGPDGLSSTGWGRRQRRAVSEWYKGMAAERLAFVGTKYAQRHGWSHRDLLLLAHVKPASPAHQLVQRFLVKGWEAVAETVAEVRAAGEACEDASLAAAAAVLASVRALATAGTGAEAAELLATTGLAREHVPGRLLAEPLVWQALLANMPPTALLRNLAKLSSVGVLVPGSDAVAHVVAKLDDHAALCHARVHPMGVLLAASTYSAGHGVRGKLRWDPVPAVVDSLDRAFYGTFATVEPANQRVLVALDVSGSMSSPIMNTALSCSQASAAMAFVTVETEPHVQVMCFSDTFQPLPRFQKGISLADAIGVVSGLDFGGTDCALPVLYAMEHEVCVDLFVVYTDDETWFGDMHPVEALRAYREVSGINARLAVVGMTATEFSIADPDDAGMMDFAGFDASTPQALAAFARGEL